MAIYKLILLNPVTNKFKIAFCSLALKTAVHYKSQNVLEVIVPRLLGSPF